MEKFLCKWRDYEIIEHSDSAHEAAVKAFEWAFWSKEISVADDLSPWVVVEGLESGSYDVVDTSIVLLDAGYYKIAGEIKQLNNSLLK